MEQVMDKPNVRADVIDGMRVMADRKAGVRELVRYVQSELGLKHDTLLVVLWYFMKAFHLPLGDILPLREWLGTADDRGEIDALILPAIARTKRDWREPGRSA